MKKTLLALASVVLALPALSNAMDYKATESPVQSWVSPSRLYVGAYQGYGAMNDMLHDDGDFAMGRLVFGLDAYDLQLFNQVTTLGLELGLQNGKTMRHAPAENDPDASVDLPIETTLDPVFDLMLNVRVHIPCDYPVFVFAKGGVAFRKLGFPNGDFVHDINQASGEFQAGIGYDLTPKVRVVAYYQGIYANGDVHYNQNSDGTVHVTNIPTQQAGFWGFEFSL